MECTLLKYFFHYLIVQLFNLFDENERKFVVGLLAGVFFCVFPSLSQANINSVNLPNITNLQHIALDFAGLHPRQLETWYKRAKFAAALPKIQVGFEQNLQDDETSIVQDNVSVSSTGVTIGPDSNRIDYVSNSKLGFEVKAVWALDQLAFNQDVILISREARDHYLVRDRILKDLHTAYFALKNLLLSCEASHNCSDPVTNTQIEQLVASLDGLTGGYFGQQTSTK